MKGSSHNGYRSVIAKDVRPGTDPVVLIKMVLDKLPHSATVSYAFCRRFPEELAVEIFGHILNKALNNRLVDSSDEANDQLICPQGQFFRHTTNKDSKRIYRSTPKFCRNCPCREQCGANTKGQKAVQRHIWQEALDLAEQIRKTELAKDIYAMRKQTIERIFFFHPFYLMGINVTFAVQTLLSCKKNDPHVGVDRSFWWA